MSQKSTKPSKPVAFKHNAICVIGGFDFGKDESFRREAVELGKAIAARGMNIVYGGGTLGLPAVAAMQAVVGGRKALSVTMSNIASGSSSNRFSYTLGDEIKVYSKQECMMIMLRHSDAFVMMPGCLETLEMFSGLMTWARYNLHKKPLGFLNVNGYFDGFLAFLMGAGEQGFLPEDISQLIVSAPIASQLVERLEELSQGTSQVIKPAVQNTKDKRKRDEPDTDLRL